MGKITKNKISKILKIVFIIILLIIIVLALAKLIFICHINKAIKMNNTNIKEQNISSILLNDEMYYNYKEIKIRNVFDTFTKELINNDSWIILKDNNTNKKLAITLYTVDMFQVMKDSIFFKRLNIYNGIDYYRYLKTNKTIYFYKYFDSMIDIINFNKITDILEVNSSKEYKINILNLSNNNNILMFNGKDISILDLYKNNTMYGKIYFYHYKEREIEDLISSIQF